MTPQPKRSEPPHDGAKLLVHLTADDLRALVAAAVAEAMDENAGAGERAARSSDLLNAKQAAEYLHIAPRTLRQYVAVGAVLPVSIRTGGRRFYRVRDLDRLLRHREPL